MPLSDYEELDLTGLDIDAGSFRGQVIRKSFGGGNKRKINVGPSYLMPRWKLSSGAWPDREDGSEINSMSRWDYYNDFFSRFTVGEDDVFVIDFNDRKWTVRFVPVELPFTMHTYDLFDNADGIEIEYAFVPGEIYDTDGSILPPDTTPPTVPEGLTAIAESSTSILLEWEAAEDPSDTTPPSVPTGFEIIDTGPGSLSFIWDASTDTGDAPGPVAGYEYRMKLHSDMSYGSAVDVGNVLSILITGLTASTEYDFEVRAYDASGNFSDWSSPVSETTEDPGLDSDASAFITATGITDATQKAAINQLVLDFKAASIWTKMHAIYPMVGGSATTHKFNLKNPTDSDGAFRLTFAGGWTHSSTGAKPNGSSGYADTHYIAATNGTDDDCHIAFYSRTNTTELIDIGAKHGSSVHQMACSGFVGPLTLFIDCYGPVGGEINQSGQVDAFGLFVDSRRSNTDQEAYQEGVSFATTSGASGGNSGVDVSYYIGARNNNGTADSFSARECAFASIGLGLSDADASAMSTAVTTYQTSLSRNV